MTLPKPNVHFDTLLRNDLPFLKTALGLPPFEQEKIILDPTGRSCGMASFAESYSTTYTMLRLSLMYHLSKEQVVVVGPRMQAAFAHTSLENVPIDLLQLPYPCFYLAVPKSEGLELWGGERTGWHNVAGVYVAKDPASNSNSLMILAWGAANERSLDPLDDATFWFRLDLDRWYNSLNLEREFSEIASDSNLEKSLGNTEFESSLYQAADELIREGKLSYPDAATALARTAAHRPADLDAALMNLLGNMGAEASDAGAGYFERGQTQSHVEKVRETARKLMRIVVNTVLYMNSSNADLSKPFTYDGERARLRAELGRLKNPRKTKGRSLGRRLDTLPKHRIVWVGPSIEESKDSDLDFTSGESGRRVAGHIRRGHWHTYLSGPRKVEGALVPKEKRARELKWIPPLWIGSSKETNVSRTYAIKETPL